MSKQPNTSTGDQRTPEERASILSRLYFMWASPTIKRASIEPLKVEDLLTLNAAEKPRRCDPKFSKLLRTSMRKTRPVLRTLWRLHYHTLLFVFAISLVCLVASLACPLLVRALLTEIQHSPNGTRTFQLAFLLLVSSLTVSLCMHHMFHQLLKLMIRVRVALIASIYRKALKLTLDSRQNSPAGQIINLMGNDAQKVANSLNLIFSVWLHPLQIIFAMVALYWILGVPALAGATVLILMLLLSAKVSQRQLAVRRTLMGISDRRVNLMNEIFTSIRIIKFYAWEKSFIKDVRGLRAQEVEQLTKIAKLSSLGSFFFLSTPVIFAFATFTALVLSERGFNAPDVFASLSLFALLRLAMTMLPDVTNALIEANISLKRIESFLQLSELEERQKSQLPVGSIAIDRAKFEWTPGSVALDDLSLSIAPGCFIGVIGEVGSGKSALLTALAGDLTKISGHAEVSGRVAYVPQQAWILNDTVKENVLFGEEYNEQRYQQVLKICCLLDDLAAFPQGDATEIGERGINLSGGQKQRISLARAAYRGADIFLFDDPLSALDRDVADKVYKNLICEHLSSSTRILVTHRLEYCNATSQVLEMEKGRIAEVLSAEKVRSEYSHLISALHLDSDTHVDLQDSSPQQTQSTENGRGPRSLQSQNLIDDEERVTGTVERRLYRNYIQVFSPPLIAAVLGIIFVVKEIFGIGSDSWLAWWSSHSNFSVSVFLTGFLTLGIIACAAIYGRVIFISLRGLSAGNYFHDQLLFGVLRAPMQFFESNPVGRILNRFSRDMESLDLVVPRTIHEVLGCACTIFSTLLLITIVFPWAIIVILPVISIYYFIQGRYRPIAREAQRLDSITRSPIFAQFSESLSGTTIIRAFGASSRFEEKMRDLLDLNSRSFFTVFASNRWLGVRIETLGCLVVAGTAFCTAFFADQALTGFAGLTLTYALMLTGAMNWAVRMLSQLESNMNSVERIDYYSKIPPERWDGIELKESWPSRGSIEFKNIEVRYRPGLDPVLKNFSLSIAPGERVGILGRTGAGKSTLFLALTRILEINQGQIEIDGQNISQLALENLRESLALIPQDPVLFSGDIRKNLDPFQRYSDEQIWSVLEKTGLAPLVRSFPKGLQAGVFESGSNLSVGQRQLICLARALLKGSKILLLDEATASIDPQTDQFLQRTLRNEFKDSTVLAIAHRVETLSDYDRLAVIDDGKIIRCDTPAKIIQDRQVKNMLKTQEDSPSQ